jgi:stage III sporulation protein SpoIIIAA
VLPTAPLLGGDFTEIGSIKKKSPVMDENLSLGRTQITDDLGELLAVLPESIRTTLEQHPKLSILIEVVMDLGRYPEARFPDGAEYLRDVVITRAELQYCVDRLGSFSGDNRAGIERTLHRISCIRNRTGEIIGLTCRVGRAVYGTINMIRDLVETGKSILMLGRPGVGKTTALREIARVLADELGKRVVIIDTSNEIAGDGDIPHSAIGRARRMQVARPELQHQVMIEAVENHMPQVIIIDEIGTELEALAARTIAERGVQLVGTAHGNKLENLLKNPTLSDLIGGIQSVTLGDDEARRRASQKTVLERKSPPTFEIAVEMQERSRWVVHDHVAETVDTLLRGRQPTSQVRTVNEEGNVTIVRELPEPGKNGLMPAPNSAQTPRGWRSTGRMAPLPTTLATNASQATLEADLGFAQLLEQNWDSDEPSYPGAVTGANGEDLPLHVYPYGIGRDELEQVIEVLNLPVVLTKDMGSADAVLALRTHIKNHAKLRQISKVRQVPIYSVKSGTIPQITRTLRRMLHMEDPDIPAETDLRLFTQTGSDDNVEALEEARLAVEQIVIPHHQPVELLPRSSAVRKLQHELIEHYRLKSASFGEDPNRRLRIFPD